MLIVAACLCWVVDNNLTHKVSGHDATLIACLKGSLARACNTGMALHAEAQPPAATPLAATLLVGFAGYGLSLTLCVLALHTLGTERTGAYFAVAPLSGVVIVLMLWPHGPRGRILVSSASLGMAITIFVRCSPARSCSW